MSQVSRADVGWMGNVLIHLLMTCLDHTQRFSNLVVPLNKAGKDPAQPWKLHSSVSIKWRREAVEGRCPSHQHHWLPSSQGSQWHFPDLMGHLHIWEAHTWSPVWPKPSSPFALQCSPRGLLLSSYKPQCLCKAALHCCATPAAVLHLHLWEKTPELPLSTHYG